MTLKEQIKKEIGPSQDYIFKDLTINKIKINIIFNETLIDTGRANDFVFRYIINFSKKELKRLENNLPNTNIKIITSKDITTYLSLGFIVIITPYNVYATEIKSLTDRGVQTISSELSITGPKDSFSENYNTNVCLLRKRIKTPELFIETIELGKSSKTKIGIAYMNNITKKDLVKSIKNHLMRINIDGIIDSSYLKRALEKKYTLFPTITLTERPDKTAMALLEGKVAIIVDMSPYILILPSFFIDFFHTTDDYYQKSLNTSFIRIIRIFAFLVSIFTPAIYIAVTTRNYNLIPLNLLLTLKAGRTFVPFPAYIEALFMIICFEILKESDLRMASTTGSAVSILGGLILGDAAVSAGIVSPIMIIVIAISSISGLTFSSIELGNALRSYKIFLLILATIFGINGLIVGTTILIYQLISLKTFNHPYLTPFIPLDKQELKDSFIKTTDNKETRTKALTNNINRGKYL